MPPDTFLKLVVSLATALVCIPVALVVRQIWVVDRTLPPINDESEGYVRSVAGSKVSPEAATIDDLKVVSDADVIPALPLKPGETELDRVLALLTVADLETLSELVRHWAHVTRVRVVAATEDVRRVQLYSGHLLKLELPDRSSLSLTSSEYTRLEERLRAVQLDQGKLVAWRSIVISAEARSLSLRHFFLQVEAELGKLTQIQLDMRMELLSKQIASGA